MLRATLHAFALASVLPVWGGLEETIDFSGIGETFGVQRNLRHYWKCGSGFFVTSDGWMVTDGWLVQDAEEVIVVCENKAYEAETNTSIGSNKFALVRVKAGTFTPVAFAQVDNARPGAKLLAAGYDVSDEKGASPSFVTCAVSDSRKSRIQVFGTFQRPMIGCPLLGADGFVAGMLTAFGGNMQVRADVLSRQSIVKDIPARVLRRMVYTGMPVYGLAEQKRRMERAMALVLVYNESKRMESLKPRTGPDETEQAMQGKGMGKLRLDDLANLTELSKKKKTHLKGSGSGFFVSEDGYLITNHHVIDGAQELMVVCDGRACPAELRAKNKERDLALLKVNGSFKPVSASTNANCEVGQSVFVVGYPRLQLQGMEAKVTKGIISCLSGFRGESSEYQMDAAIQPGNSGGPVADDSGCVVGISVATLHGSQNVNYAIKWSEVMKFLPKGVRTVEGKNDGEKSFTGAVRDVLASTVLVLNYAPGASPLAQTAMKPDQRREVDAWLRKNVLYARLAKVHKEWKEVLKITDGILEVAPEEPEAKSMNDLARDQLGLHLVIVAKAGERDVKAKVEPVCGFRSTHPECERLEELFDKNRKSDFPVQAILSYCDDNCVWKGQLNCIYTWHGTKEIVVVLQKENKK